MSPTSDARLITPGPDRKPVAVGHVIHATYPSARLLSLNAMVVRLVEGTRRTCDERASVLLARQLQYQAMRGGIEALAGSRATFAADGLPEKSASTAEKSP